MPSTSRVLLLALGLALLAGATWTGLRYHHDLDAARERVSGRSQVLQTRWGRLEYAVAGDAGGPALLMIHGTGGGFDQGLTQVGAGLRLVTPRPQQPGDAPARAGAFQMQPGQQAGLPRRQRQIGAPGVGDVRNAEELDRGHGVAGAAGRLFTATDRVQAARERPRYSVGAEPVPKECRERSAATRPPRPRRAQARDGRRRGGSAGAPAAAGRRCRARSARCRSGRLRSRR